MSVNNAQRHTKIHRCPVCDGANEDPRGTGKRCFGFTSEDGDWAHCTREDLAGDIDAGSDGAYAHRLHGSCRCGVQHGEAKSANRETKWEVLGTWDYRDERGDILFRVVKFKDKEFRQKRPDGAGGWINNLKDTRRVLYRLPELIAAKPEETIHICEGEKDVDTVRALGLTATCNPMGAGKWPAVATMAKALMKGRDVVVLADADAPGRAHAKVVEASLRSVVKSIKVLEPPKPHKDVTDLLSSGGSLADMVSIADAPSPVSSAPPPSEPVSSVSQLWEKQLLRGDGGALKKCVHNVALILTSDPAWRGAIGYDAFSERMMIRKTCPIGEPGPWSDLHDIEAAIWLQASRWKLDVSPEMVAKSVPSTAARQTFHPLRDQLNSFVWDGQPRVDTWLTDYLGAEDTPVHRAIASTWLLGACSRAFSPGSQVDAALVLEGLQGAGKSSALRCLSLGFFTDEIPLLGTKDAAMQLHGVWIVELGELDALSRADVTAVKSFITRRVDRYRAPWGRHTGDHARQCVFSGTTNQSDYLRDETGNRRWLPVSCSVVRRDELTSVVEQIWAEAIIRYRAGEATYIREPGLLAALRDHTSTRYQGDAWTDRVMRNMQGRENTSVPEVLSDLGIEVGRWTHADSTRVAKILKANGYVRYQSKENGVRTWRYRLVTGD